MKCCQSYVEIDGVLEWINELQNDAGKEDDKHDDRPHPLPHDRPGELHVSGDRLSQLSEESAGDLMCVCICVYHSIPGKHPLPGKRPCSAFQGVNVTASIQM